MAAVEPGTARGALARLRPEERIAAVYFLGVAALFAARGLPFTVARLAGEYARFLAALSLVALPFWLVARLVRAARRRPAPTGAWADVGGYLRAAAPYLLVLVGYTNLKSRLLQLRPRLYDGELEALDAALHFGGGDFVAWLLATNRDRAWLGLLGGAYFFAWAALALPLAVAFARRGAPAARRTFAALGLVYVAGGFLYLALPALGPAFVGRARYAHLGWGAPFQVQEAMLAALRAVARDPASPATPFFGIAAFPSLHLATTALGLFVAWRWCRWLLPLLVPFNLLVAWSALVWGWHYAVDFYPGVALAWGGWRAAGVLAGDDGAEPARAP